MGYFSNLFTQKVILKKKAGTDSNGKIIFKGEVEISCKVEFGSSIIIGSNSQQTACSGRIFTEYEIQIGDIVVIDNKEYLAVKVSPAFALDGKNVLNEVNFQ